MVHRTRRRSLSYSSGSRPSGTGPTIPLWTGMVGDASGSAGRGQILDGPGQVDVLARDPALVVGRQGDPDLVVPDVQVRVVVGRLRRVRQPDDEGHGGGEAAQAVLLGDGPAAVGRLPAGEVVEGGADVVVGEGGHGTVLPRLRKWADGGPVFRGTMTLVPSLNVRATAARTFRSLRVRNYRLFFYGQLVSVSGTWMQTVAQSWLVLNLTGSGVDLGLTVALQFLPMLLFGMWGGLLADRLDKRRLLVATQAAAGVLAVALWALGATGAVRMGKEDR